jgi:hypothetical integral membrane protein (TIGR02206 family)
MSILASKEFPRTFWPFCKEHWIALVISTIATLAMLYVGQKVDGSQRSAKTNRSVRWQNLLVGFAFAVAIANEIWYLHPSRFAWNLALPLHLCDLNGFVAPLALMYPNSRMLRSLLYFWGIGLATQGLISPIPEHGSESMRFWLYWVSHWVIVSYAIYDIAVRRYRTTWADFKQLAVVTTCYFVAAFILNAVSGWNYGYVGPTGERTPPVFELLGPWPYRALVLYALIMAVFALKYQPFRLSNSDIKLKH